MFLFINKMDLAGADREALLASLRERLGEGFVENRTPGPRRFSSSRQRVRV